MSAPTFRTLLVALYRHGASTPAQKEGAREAQCDEAREELRRIKADDPERKEKAQKVVARLHLAAERLEAALLAFEAKKFGSA